MFLATLTRGLAACGVACEVIVSQDHGSGGEEYLRAGVNVRCLKTFGSLKSLPLSPGALFALKGCQAAIVHLHHPNPLGDLSYVLARPAAPLVVTYHSDIVRQMHLAKLHAPLLRYILDRAAAIVVTSPHYVDSSPVLPRYRDKITVIPLGIEPPPAAWLEASPARNGGEPQYLFMGRLMPYKGVQVLLEALTQVQGRLWIAGEGPAESRLRQQAAAAGIHDRVEFLGFLSGREKWRRLAACDALVLPSLYESYGLVLVEAMAAGKPVVASDLPTGVSLLVQDGVNGRLFPPGDARALAAALRSLAADPAAARRLGEAGRRLMETHYTTARMVSEYLRLYEAVIAGAAGGRGTH